MLLQMITLAQSNNNGPISNTLTPVSTSMQVLPPNDIMRPSGLYNKLRPRLPGSPPSNPYGSKVLRSVKIDKVTGLRKSKCRSTPSPPQYLPFPPDPSVLDNLDLKVRRGLPCSANNKLRQIESDMLSDKFRVPVAPFAPVGVVKRFVTFSSWKMPFSTMRKDLNEAPSCAKLVEWGGIEPGVIPPISA
ncbi:hypothetical protein GQX74_010907 [Glossina fuscipes]|nr:hypothetical protein GQX74_010907 [Glossina fuscipes]